MEHVYILISLLCWLWWGIHIMARNYIKNENKHIKFVWKVGLIFLPLTGGLSLINPDGLLRNLVTLLFASILLLWTITGVYVWANVLKEGCIKNRCSVPV